MKSRKPKIVKAELTRHSDGRWHWFWSDSAKAGRGFCAREFKRLTGISLKPGYTQQVEIRHFPNGKGFSFHLVGKPTKE